MSKSCTNWRRPRVAVAVLLLAGLVVGGCASGPVSKPSGGSKGGARAEMAAGVSLGRDSLPFDPTGGAAPESVIALSDRNLRLHTDAIAAMKSGRLREASALFLELTEREPELSSAWVNLGRIHLQEANEDAANMALKRAISINPSNCHAHNELGILARKRGDFESAEASYLACLQRLPAFREVYLNLGILYELYLGKLSEALDAYRKYQSLSKDPDRRVQGWVVDLERRLGSNS